MEHLPLPPDERLTPVSHAVSTSAAPAPVSSFTIPARRGFWARVLPWTLAFLIGGLVGGFIVHQIYLRAAGGGEFTVSAVKNNRPHVRPTRRPPPPPEEKVVKKETAKASSRKKSRTPRPWLVN